MLTFFYYKTTTSRNLIVLIINEHINTHHVDYLTNCIYLITKKVTHVRTPCILKQWDSRKILAETETITILKNIRKAAYPTGGQNHVIRKLIFHFTLAQNVRNF